MTASAAAEPAAPRGIPALPHGSLIAVVAPAGPADPGRLAQLALLPALYAAHGFRVLLAPGCQAQGGYLAGSDATRLADLHAALADPDVAAKTWARRRTASTAC